MNSIHYLDVLIALGKTYHTIVDRPASLIPGISRIRGFKSGRLFLSEKYQESSILQSLCPTPQPFFETSSFE
jgi:hypothetical protein